MSRFESISSNLNEIKNELESSANLIAVTKTFPIEDIKFSYQAGQRHFGENKVQELSEKASKLQDECPEINWHFIGHLQSNKINQLLKVPNLKYIHSLSSIGLAEKLANKELNSPIKIFLQVNTSGEIEKDGFETLNELENAQKVLNINEKLELFGLMTIGKIRTENFEEDAKSCFQKLVSLKNELNPELELSMGMTSDFKMALEYGSNWIRLGLKIFGSR